MAVPVNTYIPSQPGQFTQNVLDARDQQASFVERKQRLAMAQEQQDMERAKFTAMLPAIVAKQGADIANAQAAVTNATIEQQLRARAANESPQLNQEFLDIMKIPDFGEQSNRLAGLQAKVSYLNVLPEYKGFVDTVNHQRSNAFISDQTNMKLEQAQQKTRDEIQGRVDAAKALGETKAELEGVKTARAKELADINAAHQQELAGVKSDFQKKNTNNRIVTAGAYKDNTAKINAGIEAKPAISQIGTAMALLDDPEVRTGSGANFELKAKRLGNALGADFQGVQKGEQLQTILGQTILEKARSLKGSISDKDVAFLERISPSFTKTPEGNKKILVALQKGYQNSISIAQMISEMRLSGDTEPEINNAVNDYALNHSIWDNSDAGATNPTASPSATPPEWNTDKQKRLDELKQKLGR